MRSILQYAVDDKSPWDGKYKIPWDEPEFSARMLKEHLSQDHDLASRKLSYIIHQVQWIHETICNSEPKRILDLGCGPGLYLKNLASYGHTGKGIDFSPASIDYAQKAIKQSFELTCADIRKAEFGNDHDLVYFIYGEFNTFSPTEIADILQRAFVSLKTGGVMLFEPYRYDAVKRIGKTPNNWYKAASGLFSDNPHLCLIENTWLEISAAAIQCFHVLDIESGLVRHYRSTTKAWRDSEYIELLKQTGFSEISEVSDWPSNNNDLFLLKAKK